MIAAPEPITESDSLPPVPAAGLPRQVPVKSAMLLGALCYLGGIVVGVRVAQMMHSPCPCEQETKAVQQIETVVVPDANPNGSEPATETVEMGAESLGTPG